MNQKVSIAAFEVTFVQEDIDNLRSRLARTRWPDWLPDSGWNSGTDEDYIKQLCAYWRDDYDFAKLASRLNAHPQYLADVEGETLHFYHVRSQVPTARPLVLVHGWPGSVVEFLDLIPSLVDPESHGGKASDAFHVIVPSLPGYGFSGPTKSHGVTTAKAGAMIAAVMQQLGYERYFLQGGDWGSITTSGMAETYADRIAALHVNMAPAGPTNPAIPVDGLSEEEATEYARLGQHMAVDSAYAFIQATRPQSLGVAMNDSPAGLAAWIIDKVWSWTDHGGDLNAAFSFDHLLDDISIYWFTGTAASSFRLYHENNFRNVYTHAVVTVPTCIARFAGEPFSWPRSLVEQNYRNIQDWHEFPKGGHFAAFQRPDDFLGSVRRFFAGQSI